MPLTMTTITGPVYLPNGATPFGGRVSFELSSWDVEDSAGLVVTGPVYVPIDENGQFSVNLFTTTAGSESVTYRMFIIWEDSILSQSYVNDIYVSAPTPHYTKKYIGSFVLSGPGPYSLSELNIVSELNNSSFDAYLEMKAFSDRIDLGALDDAVEATAADVITTTSDRVQTGLDVVATGVARNLAQAWAESATQPGGAGTKSSKTWADESEAQRVLSETARNVAQAAADQAVAFGQVYTETDAQLALITIPAGAQVIQRLPSAPGQVAPLGIVTRWQRNDTPGPDPYFTTAGGVTWTVAEITQAEILSTLGSALNAAFDSPVITGLATGTAITQTAQDTTTGRLMKVGDAGLLGPVVITGGSDTLRARALKSGMWGYNSGSLPQHPEGGLAYAHSMLTMMAPDALTGAGDRSSYLTGRVTGTASSLRLWWGVDSNVAGEINWAEVITNLRILGTVSQSAGVPTGRVIERGSNANGEYVRFADGTQRCTHSLVASAGAATTWTFPIAFAVAPKVVGTAIATVLASLVKDAASSTTAQTFSIRDKTDARRADTVDLVADGRWF